MPKKILTIDDDPYIVKYITEVLSDNGYATCSASSVEEALSVLEAEKPDLVTLDMEMPDEWGPPLLPQDDHESRIPGYARHRDQRPSGYPPRHPQRRGHTPEAL